jgi:3-oxoacyl-[acyl-carrier protein] reductase
VPLSGSALVTGGGRGIGESIARELAGAGMQVTVTARTQEQIEAVARDIGGRALVGDVSKPEDVERWAKETGDIDLLVCNAGIGGRVLPLGNPDEWWRTFEVNVRGLYLCCNAFAPGMVTRGGGRIVNIASGAAYLPPRPNQPTAYGASKAAVHRFSELLAAELAPNKVFVFSISPGLVKTEMTSRFPDDAPWTPPDCAPRLVRTIASGKLDALAGRYLHAEHDPPEALLARVDEILEQDLNAVRLRR